MLDGMLDDGCCIVCSIIPVYLIHTYGIPQPTCWMVSSIIPPYLIHAYTRECIHAYMNAYVHANMRTYKRTYIHARYIGA